MIAALGIDIARLYTIVFALGAALAGLAGALIGPIQSVQVGMGEPVLIMAFVVVVIGGIGSIKGALVGAILVGVTDTLGRFLLPIAFGAFMEPAAATAVGSALASMLIYILMAVILVWKPTGLMGAALMSRETVVNLAILAGAARRRRSPPSSLGEPFVITLATKAAILGMAGVGLNLALGYGGLVSFGHAAFFGIGGYAAGILASHAQNFVPLLTWPFEIAGTTADAGHLAGRDRRRRPDRASRSACSASAPAACTSS